MRVFFLASSAACAAAIAVACTDDPERDGFTEPTYDGGANLPEAAPPVDAGPAVDARPPFDPKDEPVTCTGAPCVKDLVAGDQHFCALLEGGTVKCWGADSFSGLSNVTQISAAGGTTCARLDDGGVSCWGKNDKGQLGITSDAGAPVFDEDPHPDPVPVSLAKLGAATRVDVGHGSVCAALAGGKLACWGQDHRSQLARVPFDPYELAPYRMPGLAAIDPLAVARTLVGTATSIALTPSGEVWTWGAAAGDDGVISGRVSSKSPDAKPAKIASLASVSSLAVSGTIQPPPPDEPGPVPEPPPPRAHACAIAGGQVHCWGQSQVGALCTGLPDKQQTPRIAPITSKYWPQQVAVADELTCVRMTDGTVQCCGKGTSGQLGDGKATLYSSTFVPASELKSHAVRVATSDATVCALVQGGTVECWGSNEHGELGTKPDADPHPSPVKIAF